MRARRLVRQVLQVGANALAMWYAVLTPPFLEETRKRGIAVWAWTVDEDIAMRDLATMGVQGIITNQPDRLNRVLDELVADGPLRPPLGRRVKRSRWGRRLPVAPTSGRQEGSLRARPSAEEAADVLHLVRRIAADRRGAKILVALWPARAPSAKPAERMQNIPCVQIVGGSTKCPGKKTRISRRAKRKMRNF